MLIESQHFGLFTAFCTVEFAREVEARGEIGGDAVGTGDPNRPKVYSRPYGIKLSGRKVGRRRRKGGHLTEGVSIPKSPL